ncbi:uncharacterized protein [Nicotiana sylvestris]|uniref:uncharacterized protein n=1 Tax=Nicotiana sylvestris TaxID=4096 RepID=UPI00388C4C14
MNAHADKGMTDSDRTYAGDWIYVKLHPCRQLSLKDYSFQKRSAKFYVPIQITHKVGVVAYTLALLVYSKIHPIFHISQLKRKIGTQLVPPVLPTVHTKHGYVLLAPEAILDRRMTPKNGHVTTQVLVKWLNCP